MTSYNPHDIRWGYCGNCETFTSPTAGQRPSDPPGPNWLDNPVVTDKPIIRNGPTRPPVPGVFDWIMRGLFTLIALAAVVYLLYIVVVT
jgi:hypothetical protein